MQGPSLPLSEQLLLKSALHNVHCSCKIVTLISLFIALTFTLLLNPVSYSKVLGPATTLATQPRNVIQQQARSLRFTQPGKIWQSLAHPSVWQSMRPVAASASGDSKDLGENAKLQHVTLQPFSRRHAGVTGFLAGLATVLQRPPPAWSGDFIPSRDFIDGPKKTKYLDKKVGDGDEVKKGDVLKVFYDIKFVNENADLESTVREVNTGTRKAEFITGYEQFPFDIAGPYLALLGEGDMPPMRVGGIRQIVLPKELGYGNDYGNCAMSGGNKYCKVPPRNRLNLLIEVQSKKK